MIARVHLGSTMMYLRTPLHAFLIGAACAATGCERFMAPAVVGSGVPVTLNHDVDQPYSELEISGTLEVLAGVGDKASLAVTADDNIAPLITVEMRGQCLAIRLKERVKPVTPIRVVMTTLPITKAACAGAVTLRLEEISADRFEASVAGASGMSLSGAVNELVIDSAGAGEIDAGSLSAKKVAVTIAGAGAVDVNAVESLNVTITGAGEVNYTGDPTIEQTIVGVGRVRKKG